MMVGKGAGDPADMKFAQRSAGVQAAFGIACGAAECRQLGRVAAGRLRAERMGGPGRSCRSKRDRRTAYIGR